MINIFICEDEELQLSYFEKIIGAYLENTNKDASIVAARRDPSQILEDIKIVGKNPSLFLIDIQLKGYSMNGFELAKELKKQMDNCYFVFITSCVELAYQAFEYELDILDYIVKNSKYFLSDKMTTSLEERFNRIFEKIEKDRNRENSKTICVECGSRRVTIALEDIIFVQAIKQEHQIEIYCVYQKLKTRKSLKEIYKLLGAEFLYVNKSCIVQRNMITEIDKKNRFVKLTGGYQIEVSYREVKNVLVALEKGKQEKNSDDIDI